MGAAVVTMLFTDIVGSTDLYQRLGDEEAERIRRGHFRLLRDAVVSVGGHEVKNLGDGLMVVFESPHEAVACAVAMQQAVARHQSDALSVRVGLHVGEPIREEEDFFGTPVRRRSDCAMPPPADRSSRRSSSGHSSAPAGRSSSRPSATSS
jgi:class 3 adenylate cyclase